MGRRENLLVCEERTTDLTDDQYLAWVRRLPCVCCESLDVVSNPWRHAGPVTRSEAHHVPIHDKAFGRKVSDRFTVPLCRRHHELAGDGSWFVAHTHLWYAIARLNFAYDHGAKGDYPL